MTTLDIMLVGLGGGLGSLLRWFIGWLSKKVYSGERPYGTLFINVSGTFILAYLTIHYGINWHHRYGEFLISFLLTGVLGGYTTFSTMELDTATLINKKELSGALVYVCETIFLSFIAASYGIYLAR